LKSKRSFYENDFVNNLLLAAINVSAKTSEIKLAKHLVCSSYTNRGATDTMNHFDIPVTLVIEVNKEDLTAPLQKTEVVGATILIPKGPIKGEIVFGAPLRGPRPLLSKVNGTVRPIKVSSYGPYSKEYNYEITTKNPKYFTIISKKAYILPKSAEIEDSPSFDPKDYDYLSHGADYIGAEPGETVCGILDNPLNDTIKNEKR
jgi:hypothetical protein